MMKHDTFAIIFYEDSIKHKIRCMVSDMITNYSNIT